MNDTSSPTTIELLTFRLAEQEYALNIMSVREIRGWTHATPLPHAPKYMKGVINLRGTVLPVLDLGARLALADREQNQRSVIIVVKHQDKVTGLLVDAVSDIITLTKADLQPPPTLSAGATDNVVSALILTDDRMIRVLDLHSIVTFAQHVAA